VDLLIVSLYAFLIPFISLLFTGYCVYG